MQIELRFIQSQFGLVLFMFDSLMSQRTDRPTVTHRVNKG